MNNFEVEFRMKERTDMYYISCLNFISFAVHFIWSILADLDILCHDSKEYILHGNVIYCTLWFSVVFEDNAMYISFTYITVRVLECLFLKPSRMMYNFWFRFHVYDTQFNTSVRNGTRLNPVFVYFSNIFNFRN